MMKRTITVICLMLDAIAQGDALPDVVMSQEIDGVVWYYSHPSSGNSYSSVTYSNVVYIGYYPQNSYVIYKPVPAVSTNTVGEITIPSVLGGLPVAGICQGAFQNCREITKITIPSCITVLDGPSVDGKPVISWSPELSAAQTALREYKVYGKVKLADANWSIVDGNESDYNFFKVTVEMK